MRRRKESEGSLRKIKREGREGDEADQEVGQGMRGGNTKRRKNVKRSVVVGAEVLMRIVGTEVEVRAGRVTGRGEI